MVPMHDVILKNDRQESVCVCWGGRGGGHVGRVSAREGFDFDQRQGGG